MVGPDIGQHGRVHHLNWRIDTVHTRPDEFRKVERMMQMYPWQMQLRPTRVAQAGERLGTSRSICRAANLLSARLQQRWAGTGQQVVGIASECLGIDAVGRGRGEEPESVVEGLDQQTGRGPERTQRRSCSSSMLMPSERISFTSTLNDSGMPASIA